VNRLIERCAMLDVHKSQITACVRVPDDHGGRRQEIQASRPDDGRVDHAGRLAAQLRGDRRRDGIPPASTGARSSTCLRTTLTAGFTTPATYVTSPVASATSRTPSGAASCSSTAWSARVSCRRARSASCAISSATGKAKIQERGREVQRVEKTLQDAEIKLSSVASEVLGKSGRLMLDALISGTNDPEILARACQGHAA
jgi:transposase